METMTETETINKVTLSFDPSEAHVLGVFGNNIHVESDGYKELSRGIENFDCVLIIPREEYFRIWNLWLDGKKGYCERYNEYCGVMGYTIPEEFKEVDKIILNKFNPDKEEYINVPTRAFYVDKFETLCDFEHG